MIYISERQSKEINALRVFLVFLVIYIHEFGAKNEQYGLVGSCVENLASIAVPTFFIISGFFLFYKIDDYGYTEYCKKIKKRFFTLFIPYFFWNLWPCIMITGGNLFSIVFRGKSFDALISYYGSLWNDGFFRIFWANDSGFPSNGPLWYVRDLMVLLLISPLIYLLIKKISIIYLSIISFLYVFFKIPEIAGLFPGSIVFFSLGAYFAIKKKNIMCYVNNNKYVLFFVSFVLYILSTFILEGYVQYIILRLFSISMSLASLKLFHNCSDKSLSFLSNISKSVFFIYAIHITLLAYISKFLYHIPIVGESFLFVYFMSPLITMIVGAYMYFILRRFVPGLMKVICGGR